MDLRLSQTICTANYGSNKNCIIPDGACSACKVSRKSQNRLYTLIQSATEERAKRLYVVLQRNFKAQERINSMLNVFRLSILFRLI
jgi:hypothetical protein